MLTRNRTKKFIRNDLKRILDDISKNDKIKGNQLIINKLFSLDEFKRAKRVMFYVSKNNEVDTHKAIKIAIKIGKEVITPKIINKMIFPYRLYSFDDLLLGPFSILEPSNKRKTKKSTIDLFVIPGIAFDVSGNRIGYGYGYWDRFLNCINKKIIIGLAFESQIVSNIIKEPHDVNVSKIITDKKVILC